MKRKSFRFSRTRKMYSVPCPSPRSKRLRWSASSRARNSQAVAPLVGRLLDEGEQPHAERIGIEADARHGGDGGIDPGEIDLMAVDAVVPQEELLVPVARPALVHDLGPDLRLEVEGGLADDLDDRLHPLVLFPVQELGVVQQELDQVAARWSRGRPRHFSNMRLELGVPGGHHPRRSRPRRVAVSARTALVVAVDLLHVLADADLLAVLQEDVEIEVHAARETPLRRGPGAARESSPW